MRSSLTAAAMPLLALAQADATTIWATKTVSICPTQNAFSQGAPVSSVFVPGQGNGQTQAVDVTHTVTETVHAETLTVTVTKDIVTVTETVHGSQGSTNMEATSDVPSHDLGAVSLTRVSSVPYSFHNTTAVSGVYQNATGSLRVSTSTVAGVAAQNTTAPTLIGTAPITTYNAAVSASPVASQNATLSGYFASTALSCSSGQVGKSTIYKTSTNNGAPLSIVYITPEAETVYTTTTVTSTSTIPTKAGFLPIVDTTATVYPGANISDYPVLIPGSGLTKRAIQEPASPCTSAVTLFPVQSGASTSTLAQQTVTSTATSTVTVPYYAACGASNLIDSDPVTGVPINDVSGLSNRFATKAFRVYNLTNAYDCCARCQEEENCASSAFSPDSVNLDTGDASPVCLLNVWDTCDVANNQGQWIADGNTQNRWTVSNGKCGFLSRNRAPRCRYVYRDNDVQCDINCDGSYSQHLSYAEWEAAPALGECPLVAGN